MDFDQSAGASPSFCPQHRSLTPLDSMIHSDSTEMQMLQSPRSDMDSNSYFYSRDPTFLSTVPPSDNGRFRNDRFSEGLSETYLEPSAERAREPYEESFTDPVEFAYQHIQSHSIRSVPLSATQREREAIGKVLREPTYLCTICHRVLWMRTWKRCFLRLVPF